MFGIDAGHFGVLFGAQSRQPNPCWRNDALFIQKLTWLIKLRDFIDREPIEIKSGDQDKLNFGADNSLIYNHRGTDVSAGDWALLEERTRVLMSYMTPDLLRRFELRLAPKALFWLPIILATVAAVALGMSVFPPHTLVRYQERHSKPVASGGANLIAQDGLAMLVIVKMATEADEAVAADRRGEWAQQRSW